MCSFKGSKVLHFCIWGTQAEEPRLTNSKDLQARPCLLESISEHQSLLSRCRLRRFRKKSKIADSREETYINLKLPAYRRWLSGSTWINYYINYLLIKVIDIEQATPLNTTRPIREFMCIVSYFLFIQRNSNSNEFCTQLLKIWF